jgi:hypothetical protein
MDAQLKAGLKNWASKWKIEQLIKLGRPAGHVKLSMKREDIIDAMEKLIEEFNSKQNSNPTIDKCFLEVGQDIFNDDLSLFNKRLEKLGAKALYKKLIEAHTAAQIEAELEVPVGIPQ